MRSRLVFPTLGSLAIGFVLLQIVAQTPAQSQEAQGTKRTAESDDVDGLKASAVEFEKAFNAGDAKAIAAQFTENAEAIDEDGEVTQGRANIESRFAQLFKENPKARVVVELTSLRKLSPDVAVEDGYSTTTLTPEERGSRSPYTVVHVKRNGKWLIASVRDFPEEPTEANAHEQLQELEWLVGKWIDESLEGRVETNCQWSKDGNYLIQEYTAKSRRGFAMKGTQRIAWDPFRRTIRSWAFDESGAFTEATWTPVEDAWVLNVDGVTPDGRGVTVTRVITMVNNDAFQIDSKNMVVGNDLLGDSTVRVVRIPPEPKQ